MNALNIDGDQQADLTVHGAAEVKALPAGWRDYFRGRLETAAGS